MSVSSPVTEWELEYRPGKLRLYAVIAAAVVLTIHIVFGALLTSSTPASAMWVSSISCRSC